ncbi:uncharacterized protein BO80DRAFT_25737 [Aspergillus ibericus CBS 121593]|uniref:Uncharacterized protein n=1 Tax=Aspergillus ibericus CBS 121593 TaxID=1448316 RepID=A0A395H880_9EURO|nr:hypothetical protein BO80DRAFT_25737 [Aspergillus ibericus CBS 121593]RAL03088.1 hypothetical protein BO80DRAFT_25737 [Aspergillus ibericus CBS 121593]
MKVRSHHLQSLRKDLELYRQPPEKLNRTPSPNQSNSSQLASHLTLTSSLSVHTYVAMANETPLERDGGRGNDSYTNVARGLSPLPIPIKHTSNNYLTPPHVPTYLPTYLSPVRRKIILNVQGRFLSRVGTGYNTSRSLPPREIREESTTFASLTRICKWM